MNNQSRLNGLFPGKKFLKSNSNLRMSTDETGCDDLLYSKRKFQSQMHLNNLEKDNALMKRGRSQISVFTNQNYNHNHNAYSSSKYTPSTSKAASNDVIIIDDDDDVDQKDLIKMEIDDEDEPEMKTDEIKVEIFDDSKVTLIAELESYVKDENEKKELLEQKKVSKDHFSGFKSSLIKTGKQIKSTLTNLMKPRVSSKSFQSSNKIPSFSSKSIQVKDRKKTLNQLLFYQPSNFDSMEKSNEFLLKLGFSTDKKTPQDIERLINEFKIVTLGVTTVVPPKMIASSNHIKVDGIVTKFINTPDPIRLNMSHNYVEVSAKSSSVGAANALDVKIGNYLVKVSNDSLIQPQCFENRFEMLLARSEELKMFLISANIKESLYEILAMIQRTCDPYMSIIMNRMDLLNAELNIKWMDLFANLNIGNSRTRLHNVIKLDTTKRHKWYGGISLNASARSNQHRNKYGALLFEVIAECSNSYDAHLIELIVNSELQLLFFNGEIGGVFNKSLGYDSPSILSAGLKSNKFIVYVIASENPYKIDKKSKGLLNIKLHTDNRDPNKSYCLPCGSNIAGSVSRVKDHVQIHIRENIECKLCDVLSKNQVSAKHHQLVKHKLNGVFIYCPHDDCKELEMIPVTSMMSHQERVHGVKFV